ncbi:hypothetical protein SAMN05421543_1712 [Alicyclobacillus macrosporangiidus]|uniref:Uncharacterized protein n=1 Tax=Alicyclobacillus macrosporangiidus TaxID=392015 RepID=A0A1I7LK58_9BACL|nr:hypothetical protein SAMN05421543_1712 [Alicyclobacillus macrosporangiidus]
MGIVDEAVEHSVCDGEISERAVPRLYRQLAFQQPYTDNLGISISLGFTKDKTVEIRD